MPTLVSIRPHVHSSISTKNGPKNGMLYGCDNMVEAFIFLKIIFEGLISLSVHLPLRESFHQVCAAVSVKTEGVKLEIFLCPDILFKVHT
jgi:hypothetical protein